MTAAIQICHLSKRFGGLSALDNVNLEVPKGTIFGLLGPNGAGKTTLVKILLDLTRPSQGKVILNGHPSILPSARKKVAYLPEKFGFFPHYTAYGVLEFFGKMRGLTGKKLEEAIDQAFLDMRITELRKRKVKNLSKGQLQRVGLASTFVGENSLLILDEPFSGFDPITRKEVKALLQYPKNHGLTVMISGHILAEMESLCDGIAILDKGRLLKAGQTKELIGKKSLEDYFYDLVIKKE